MERLDERYEPIDNLMKAQATVAEHLNSACKLVIRSWRSPKVLVNVYDASIRLVILGLAITWLLPNTFQAYTTAATRFLGSALSSSPVWASIFALVSAVAWFVVASAPLDYLVRRFPAKRPVFVIAQALIIVPVLVVLVERTLNYLSGYGPAYSNTGGFARYYFGLTLSFNVLPILILVPVVAGIFLAPPPLVLAISNRIPQKFPWSLRSHDALIRRVVEESFPTTQGWSEATTRRISSLARKKTEGQLAQIQAVTPALGVLGLLALLSLVLPSEQIQAIMESLNGYRWRTLADRCVAGTLRDRCFRVGFLSARLLDTPCTGDRGRSMRRQVGRARERTRVETQPFRQRHRGRCVTNAL